MHHQWDRWLIGAVCASLIGIGAGTADAAPAWSVGAKQFITVKDMSSLDVHLEYENIGHAPSSVVDLSKMEEETDGQTVRELIASYQLPTGDLFGRGKLITAEERQQLLDNRNLAPIGKMQPIGYGVAVRRANVKGLPTGGGLFASQDDMERDVLQQGALDPCEPVRLLHVSRDKRHYFVQGSSIRGWVFIGDIAVAKKSVWQEYAQPSKFLTVISRGERVKRTGETVYVQMGAKLPLRSETDKQYKVTMPLRGEHGKLVEEETMIDKKEAFRIGCLDYTADNVNGLANAYDGAPYGYRGLKNSEDSIGMITDIYRAMGITLPREASELKTAAEQLPPCGDIAILAADENSRLVISRNGTRISVIGKTDDNKLGIYTIDDTSGGRGE